MRSSFWQALRLRPSVAIPALAGAAVASLVCATACLTDPPPDLPGQNLRPQIAHDALQPPEGATLSVLPAEFSVPIEAPDPSACSYAVFDLTTSTPLIDCRPCVTAVDAGLLVQTFALPQLADDMTVCHRIEVVVAGSFTEGVCGVPSSTLGDTAVWYYAPPTCLPYDAGALSDGAFPDATGDGLPVVPESGGGGE